LSPSEAKEDAPLSSAIKSPTLRAVQLSLRTPVGRPSQPAVSSAAEETAVRLAIPTPRRSVPPIDPGGEAGRVFLELDDPSLIVRPAGDESLGENSVWLELGDPGLGEETTQREHPPGEGRETADVLAAGGAVRVDLSLGTEGTPDLEQHRGSVEAARALRSWPGDSHAEPSLPTDLRPYVGEGGPPLELRTLEDEATDKGPLLEDGDSLGSRLGRPPEDHEP
jgi:hypothetical protein